MRTFLIKLCFSSILLFNSFEKIDALEIVSTPAEACALFPKTVTEVEEIATLAEVQAIKTLESIFAIPAEQRTFDNTVMQLDLAMAEFDISRTRLHSIVMLHPDKTLQEAASNSMLAMQSFSIDNFANKAVYRAVMEYYNGKRETLNEQRDYYLHRLLASFKKAGFMLEERQFEQMKEIRKELSTLGRQFDNNIATNKSSLVVSQESLQGISEDFVKTLPKEGSNYVLKCDYPTRDQIMNNCVVESTRRDFARQFSNRAFPENWDVLNQIINKRDELAKLLGYKSYADYDIDSEMAAKQEIVDSFLKDKAPEALLKSKVEWETLLKDLPESISLTEEGKMKSWDESYVWHQYKKNHLKVDSEKIAEYFPMEDTLQGILGVLGDFYGIKLKTVRTDALWHPEAKMVEARSIDNKLLGYIVLDLFPRTNKYTHGCCECVVPPITVNGVTCPAVVLIVTNFTKPTLTKPALFKHHELKTLFHEFGHTMHALLGTAEMPTKAGYNSTMDFVEAPSQLMEEWIYDADVLKRISKHYVTKQKLSDEQIETLIKARDFGLGTNKANQIALSQISLDYFKEGQNKDMLKIARDLYATYSPNSERDPESHFMCSFGHLNGYGAKYYGYLWSKEYALQMYDYIKSHGGPLNTSMGQRYVSKVIGKGGGCDPNEAISDFLGP